MARADGSLRLLLAKLSRIDVLVIDDWAMAQLNEPERRDFWEICEEPLSNAIDDPDFATARRALARTDRRPDRG